MYEACVENSLLIRHLIPYNLILHRFVYDVVVKKLHVSGLALVWGPWWSSGSWAHWAYTGQRVVDIPVAQIADGAII